MTGHETTLLILRVVKIALLGLGGSIAYLAWTGWRRSRDRTMLFLAVGFVLVTAGVLLQGLLFELANFGAFAADLFASVVVLAGFGAILWSLYR